MSTEDFELERRSKELFERSIADVDGPTRARLAAARRTALEVLDRPRRRLPVPALAAAATGVAAAAIGVAWLLGTPRDTAGIPQMVAAEDLELLLELDVVEDLDFYHWLEQQPELRDGGGAG